MSIAVIISLPASWGKINFADSDTFCTFAVAYARNVSMQEKHCDNCPLTEISAKYFKRRTEHFAFACLCMLFPFGIPFRREMMTSRPRSSKGVCRRRC